MIFKHLVCDYNGTLACDGMLLPDIGPLLHKLSADLEIHIVTADTFGIVQKYLANSPVHLTIIPRNKEDEGKVAFVRQLGAVTTVCIGNGRNDILMLKRNRTRYLLDTGGRSQYNNTVKCRYCL